MKRFQQALQEDGAYNSVAFSYQFNAPEIPAQYPQIPTGYEAIKSSKYIIWRAKMNVLNTGKKN